MKFEYQYLIEKALKTVNIEPDGDLFRVTIDGKVYTVTRAALVASQFRFEIDGRRSVAYIAYNGDRRYVALDGDTWRLSRVSQDQPLRKSGQAGLGGGQGTLEATMPGQVLDILVAEGDAVEQGQILILLEAMKMELRIIAPDNGVIRRVHCGVGQVVERGQMLVELEERNA